MNRYYQRSLESIARGGLGRVTNRLWRLPSLHTRGRIGTMLLASFAHPLAGLFSLPLVWVEKLLLGDGISTVRKADKYPIPASEQEGRSDTEGPSEGAGEIGRIAEASRMRGFG